ncbi:MAG: hypothetical protein EAZ89_07895 [Bacteroidetes bacterium]|nr:MAG: hypothetical protein EAZ89_07895 [Bacteroidota bacterium]
MRSTGEQLYGGSLNAFKRDYYLDELFNSSTPAPDWASAGPAYSSVTAAQKTAVFTENFLNNFAGWNIGSSTNTTTQITNGYLFFESKSETNAYFTSKQINLDDEKDFEIETAIRFASGENSAMIEWGGASGNDLFFYGFTPDSTAFTGNWTTGVAASRPSDLLRPNEYNKLTIRRIGEYYYLYINESLFEVLKFEPFYGNLFAFYVGPKTAIQVDYLRVSVLN